MAGERGLVVAGFLTWIGGLAIVLVAVLVDRGPLMRPTLAISAAMVALAIAVVAYAVTLPGEPSPVAFAFPQPMPEADQRAFELLLLNDPHEVRHSYHRLGDRGFCVVWDMHATDAEVAEVEQAWAALGVVRAEVKGCSL